MPATLDDWLLLGHLLAAMAWVGGVLVLQALATYVLRAGDADAVRRFCAQLRVAGPIVLGPGTALVLALGVWLALDSDAWSFDQPWLQVALGLFAGVLAVGAGFQARAAIAAQRAAEAGDDAEAVRRLRQWTWGSRAALVLLVAIAWDMVFKPGL